MLFRSRKPAGGTRATEWPSPERHSVVHEGEEIAYAVISGRDKRRRRTVIKVLPGRRVELHLAPADKRADHAALMRSHAPWVVRKLREQARQLPLPEPIAYREGEIVYHLGEKLTTVFRTSPRRHVLVEQDRLCLYGPVHKPEHVRKQLHSWESATALELYKQRIAALAEGLPWVEHLPPVRVRRMKSRWGSCSSHGSIVMNTRLMGAPLELVDYVLLHELCHLKEHNHSSRFYALMTSYMPGWELHRKALSAYGPALLGRDEESLSQDLD